MRKLNCFVIDDERHACDLLQHYIEQDDRLSFIGSYHNTSNFDPNKHSIDVLFLDIEMPGMKGIDFLKNTNPSFKTIFTTAYVEYAIDGFELGVTDYLLKPILNKRFSSAIDKVVTSFETAYKSEQLDMLQAQHGSITLKSGTTKIKIAPDQILYIVAQNEYISIYSMNDRHSVFMRMKDIEEDPNFNNLLRIHRSYFVNPLFVKEVHTEHVILGEEKIPIGRSYKKLVKEKLK